MSKTIPIKELVIALAVALLFGLAGPFLFLAQASSIQAALLDETPWRLPEIPQAINGLPIAYDKDVSTPEETLVNFQILAEDPDGDDLTWTIVSPPANGVLAGTPPDLNYTPDLDFNGSDSFMFKVNDGSDDSNVATVSLNVTPVNDVPIAVADAYETGVNVTLIVDTAHGVLANDIDPDGPSLTSILVLPPVDGVLTFRDDGSFNYKPATGFSGSVTFTYMVSDGVALSQVATVTLTVGDVNTEPVAVAESYAVYSGFTLTVDAVSGVLANDFDADGDLLTAQLVGGAVNGTLTFNTDGSFVYVPDAGYYGSDHFTYQAFDSLALSNPVMVVINVMALDNSAPTAMPDYYSLETGTSLMVEAAQGVLANDLDEDGDELIAQLVGGAVFGTLTLNPDGSFSYVPGAGYIDADHFTYQAYDGMFTSAPVMVTIYVPNRIFLPLTIKYAIQ